MPSGKLYRFSNEKFTPVKWFITVSFGWHLLLKIVREKNQFELILCNIFIYLTNKLIGMSTDEVEFRLEKVKIICGLFYTVLFRFFNLIDILFVQVFEHSIRLVTNYLCDYQSSKTLRHFPRRSSACPGAHATRGTVAMFA